MILVAVFFTFAMSSVIASTKVADSRVIFYDLRTNGSILRQLVKNQNQSAQLKSPIFQHGCECQGSKCGCCVGVHVPVINWDEKVCANASLNDATKEWELGIYMNEKSLATYKLSTEKPLYCIPISTHENICLKVRDISMAPGTLHLCLDLLLQIFSRDIYTFNFPCVDLARNLQNILDQLDTPADHSKK